MHALVSALNEKVGGPYKYIPAEMMQWARGAGKGFCGTCGSLIAASTVANMISDNETANQIALGMWNWYADVKFPSDEINKRAHNKDLYVDDYKTSEILPQEYPGSIICHVSVTRWCKKSGYASGSSERSERCARVTGDVAYKLTELLNQLADGKFKRKHKIPNEVNQCRSCHSKGTPYEKGHWTRGKLRCNNCHGADPKNTAKHVPLDHYPDNFFEE